MIIYASQQKEGKTALMRVLIRMLTEGYSINQSEIKDQTFERKAPPPEIIPHNNKSNNSEMAYDLATSENDKSITPFSVYQKNDLKLFFSHSPDPQINDNKTKTHSVNKLN